MAKLLLDKGAAVDVVSKLLGDTALMLAARNGGHEAVAKLLLGKGASDGAANEDSDTALILAAQYGHEAVAALLLDKGAVVDAATKDGATARRGSRISTTACPGGEYGWTALMWAAQEGHEAVVKLLLDKGAAVDKALKDGHTALIIAAQKGHAAVAKVLLDKGAALRTSHAVKQRLCSVECGDGRVAAVDEDCRARRPTACSSAGVMLSCCCSCCIVLQFFLSACRPRVCGRVWRTRCRRRGALGRRVSDAWIFFACGPFLPALHVRFSLRVVTLVTTFFLGSWFQLYHKKALDSDSGNVPPKSPGRLTCAPLLDFRRYVVQAGRGVLRL